MESRDLCNECLRHADLVAIPSGIVAICCHAKSYPQGLLQLPDMPAMLYAIGSSRRLHLLEGPCVAVVGARRASPYGLEIARNLGSGLAEAGVTVVSGMAFGVDAAAHRGAIEAGGPTVAVLAGGVDQPYPRSNRGLYRDICQVGLVMSELTPGTEPRRWSFPARNRIMAGLSSMTVVVEARGRSGSLITADIAASLGRDVGAVPGMVNSQLAAGTNALISDGAKLVRGAEDILNELELSHPEQSGCVESLEISDTNTYILSRIENGYNTLDQLASCVNGVGLTTGLTQLEILGLVKRGPDGRYMRTMKQISSNNAERENSTGT